MGCGSSTEQIASTENNKFKDKNIESRATAESIPEEKSKAIAPGTTNSPGKEGRSTFEQDALKAHNDYRRIHGAPPLQLDLKMCQEANNYAKKLAEEKQLRHSSSVERDGQGENLALSGGTQGSGMTGKYATEMWYSEVKDYDFQKPEFTTKTGHFTQLVWKESKKFGVGAVDFEKDGMQCTVVVGRYFPAGNVFGAFQENVSSGFYRCI